MLVRTKLIFAVCLSLLLAGSGVPGQESAPLEYRLKAAFLFNFAKFIDWPANAFADAKSPFIIGVLGENPFGNELEETVRGKTVNDRPLQVRTCPSTAEATNCHILFITHSEKEPRRLPEVFAGLRGLSVLTVGETKGFVEAGGMVNFFSENNKIRFQINDETAKAAGLKISSKLLSLAVRPSR